MITYDKGEQIKYIARRHKVAFFIETIFLIIAALLPYLAYLHGLNFWLFDIFTPSVTNIFFLLLSLYGIWLTLLWVIFFIAWSDYYLDIWIITDGRVIDVKQKGVFHREINTFRLDKITDMILVEKNWLGKIFNYGDIHVTLAGQVHKFIIAEVPEPEKVKEQVINEQRASLERLKSTVQFEEGK